MANGINISADVAALLLALGEEEQASVGAVVLQQGLNSLASAQAEAERQQAEERARREAVALERADQREALEAFGSPDGRGGRVLAFSSANEAEEVYLYLLSLGLRVYRDLVPVNEGGAISIIRAVMPK